MLKKNLNYFIVCNEKVFCYVTTNEFQKRNSNTFLKRLKHLNVNVRKIFQ